MLKAVELLPDKSIFIGMNTTPNSRNAAANDVKCHLKCWVNTQRKALNIMPEKQEIQIASGWYITLSLKSYIRNISLKQLLVHLEIKEN